jgi:hypothetical protein
MMETKFYSSKSTSHAWLWICSLVIIFALSATNADAQCFIVANDSLGNEVLRTPISCDFPIYVSTGNSVADQQNYDSARLSWMANHPDDYHAFQNISIAWIEVHEADVNAMATERRNVIMASPAVYHIR